MQQQEKTWALWQMAPGVATGEHQTTFAKRGVTGDEGDDDAGFLASFCRGGDSVGAMTVSRLEEIIASLRRVEADGGATRLLRYRTQTIAEGLARVSEAWLEPESRWMQQAVEGCSGCTGYTPEMVRWSLTDLFRRMTTRGLSALVEFELGSRDPFLGVRSGRSVCGRAANPPSLVFQVLAGTVPPVAVESIVLAILARAPMLVKTSRRDPVVARVYLASLRALAPELAERIAITTWEGGDNALDGVACRSSSIVTAYGGDEPIDELRSRCRFPTRFIGYGHRVSFGVVACSNDGKGEPYLQELVRDIALDVAAYDQHGCMSPHVIYVHAGAAWSADDVARALGEEGLPAVQRWLPRGVMDEGLRAQIMQSRGVGEFEGNVYESDGGVVIRAPGVKFRPSPGGRLVYVCRYDDVRELRDALAPLAGKVSTVGMHCGANERAGLVETLREIGARRVTRLGRMQRPLWIRDHDGRPRIGDWVDWTNVEPMSA